MTTVAKTMLLAIFGGVVFFVAACASRGEIGITHLPDRFTDREHVRTAFYIPDARLIATERSVVGWDRRLSGTFEHAPGENYILHIMHEHYDKKGGVIDPDYAYQVNVEIPAELFMRGTKVPAASLAGFLVWGGRHSLHRREYAGVAPNRRFVPSEKGTLRIEKIRGDGALIADVNLYFRDAASREEIRVFGKIAAPRMTREDLRAEDARAKARIYERSKQVEREAWDSSRFHSLEKF